MKPRAGVLLALVMAVSGPAGAAEPAKAISGEPCTIPQGLHLAPADEARIAHLTASRTKGLGEAMRAPSARDRSVVAGLYAADLLALTPAEIAPGPYRCRTIKLGGISDLVVYQWFKCEVKRTDQGLFLDKLTGSQNFSGRLYTNRSAGLLFVGAGHYGYEKSPRAYGDDPKRNIVGCMTGLPGEPGHYILEEPHPVFESTHDVIELRAGP